MITLRDGKLHFEPESCHHCQGTGRVHAPIPCPTCRGTGKGPRGGARGCRACFGSGDHYDDQHWQICPVCQGQPAKAYTPTIYDSLPREIWKGLTFRVIRSDRRQTVNEYLLGMGFCFSVTDYGRHKQMTDAELIAKVRDGEYSGTQVLNVAKADGTLCDYVEIITNDNGYSVKGVYNA